MNIVNPKYNTILGIETSCDETAAAIVQLTNNRVKILSNIISSSIELQSKFGGIIPEQAAREQIKVIIPVINESLEQAQIKMVDIDAIAVTQGPGLIGSLLVGVETAKTLASIYKKPLLGVNHLTAHFYANWISDTSDNEPKFPILGVLVSGGHTDLIILKGHNKYKYLGGTRDDAAGECFDKSARLLGLPYPGGPQISKLAFKGNPKSYILPRPMIESDDFDMSFSGLKTAVVNLIIKITDNKNKDLTVIQKTDLAASIKEAIIDIIVNKTIKAAKMYHIEQIMIAGGVAANPRLREVLTTMLSNEIPKSKLFIPPFNLCTDNGVVIATSALFNPQEPNPLNLQANPSLSISPID